MATQRRNALSNRDALFVTAAAIVAGLLTSLAGCQPTGQPLPDAVICFAGAAFVTWTSATTLRWTGNGAAVVGWAYRSSFLPSGDATATACCARPVPNRDQQRRRRPASRARQHRRPAVTSRLVGARHRQDELITGPALAS